MSSEARIWTSLSSKEAVERVLDSTPSMRTSSPFSVSRLPVSMLPASFARVRVPDSEVTVTSVSPVLFCPMLEFNITSLSPVIMIRPDSPVDCNCADASVIIESTPCSTTVPALIIMFRSAVKSPNTWIERLALMIISASSPAAIKLPRRVESPTGFNSMLPLRVSSVPRAVSSKPSPDVPDKKLMPL